MWTEDLIYFRARLDDTWQEYEGRIEENLIYVGNNLVWVLDEHDYIPKKQQLESILLLSSYELIKIYWPDEMEPSF